MAALALTFLKAQFSLASFSLFLFSSSSREARLEAIEVDRQLLLEAELEKKEQAPVRPKEK